MRWLDLVTGIPLTKVLGGVLGLGLLAAPAVGGWWLASQRYEAKLLRQAEDFNARIDQRNDALREMRESVLEAGRRRADLQNRYDELASKPPRVVVRTEERIRYIDRVIQSPDCAESAAELVDFVRELRAAEVAP